MNWYKIAQKDMIIDMSSVNTGEPCIVEAYHGTPDGRFLPEFDPNKKGYYPDNPEVLPDNKNFINLHGGINKGFSDKSITGNLGVSFTDDYQTAKSYRDKPAWDNQNSIPMVVKRYIKLNNPKVIDLGGEKWKYTVGDDINNAINEGFDSLVLKNIKDNYHPFETKKATNNLIIFNAKNIFSSLNDIPEDADEGNKSIEDMSDSINKNDKGVKSELV